MENLTQIRCPLCNDTVDKLLYRYHLDGERNVIERIKEHNPAWSENDGACSRCIDYYHTEIVMQQRVLPEIGPYFQVRSADDFLILPTGLRLDAYQQFSGKGVTICFIDSGFCQHPDLTVYKSRIKEIIDIPNNRSLVQDSHTREDLKDPSSWHGTMTSVVCAGDGYLSNGLYKGIASDAELVLLKVQDNTGKISTANIVKALKWVIDNHAQYAIRIVNMSLGDEEAISYKESEVDKLAGQLTEMGICIVAAVGNDENGLIKPPANSPDVIAVGGINDGNSLKGENNLYHSSYGKTVDGIMKPELVAQAIWIAAPILPGTREQAEAEVLYQLAKAGDEELVRKFSELCKKTELDKDIAAENDVTFIRKAVINRIRDGKYVSPHYMHVDGTSFAAPIVSSVIAQMLEADPLLTPSMIREVLFSTAKRIEGLAAERQGFGVIQPQKALLKILKGDLFMKPHTSPYINGKQKTIEFYVRNNCASQISLAGSFNHWAQDVLLMEPHKKGIWKIKIPMLPAGRYYYKFFVDDKDWIEDVYNPYREPDGCSGFNSVLIIEN